MASVQVVTLDDVKAHLNFPPGDPSHDLELQGFIDAATNVVAYLAGPVLSTSYTNEVHDGGWPIIMLYNPPILSVDSVVEYIGTMRYVLTEQPPGSTVDNYGFSLDDPASGKLVRRSAAGTVIPFWGERGGVVVSYTAGRVSVPAEMRMAALEDIRGLYQGSQYAGRPSFAGVAVEEEDTYANAGPVRQFPRLEALLTSVRRLPGIA